MKLCRIHPSSRWLLAVTAICAGLFTGCQTPDLKPFADASTTLSVSVRKGGELAIKPLASMPVWVGDELVQPGAETHPYQALEASWELRRRTMDALLVYSTSLEAINQAAAHRQENARQLVSSVQQLASAVPAYGAAFNSAGDLIVKGLEITVEVKAWHDMRRAVAAADPAIQLVARGLTKDLTELSNLFQTSLADQLTKTGAAIRPVARREQALRAQRDAQRESVAKAPGDAGKGAELDRLESLYGSALADLGRIRADRAQVGDQIEQGKDFFANANLAVTAWAGAHAEIVTAFKEKRTPNIGLLVARAAELKEIVDQLKTK